MEQTKIIRLKDGCDILANIELVRGEYVLEYPMIVDLIYRKNSAPELQLTNWLPLQLIEGTSVTISVDEVVFQMEPNAHLKEYYKNLVDKVSTFSQEEEEMIDKEHIEQLATALEELETYKGIIIH